MTRERETLEMDDLFVGAGPASLAGARHLARLLKAHNAYATTPVELTLTALEEGAEVGAEHLWWLTDKRAWSLPEPPPMRNRGSYVASLGRLVKWMAKEAEALGVDVFCEFPGRDLLTVEPGRKVEPEGAPGKAG